MRNNEERLGINNEPDVDVEAPPPPKPAFENEENQRPSAPFSYVTPTEIVDLPSAGQHYPAGHPLHNEPTVEIRYMTAKDEDILTSPSLLKKGLAIDRFLQNIVLNIM